MVELMVSIAVLSILVLMLSDVFNRTSRAWMTGETGIERRREARAIIDFITTELRDAALPVTEPPPPADLAVPKIKLPDDPTKSQAQLQFVVNPPGLPIDYRNGDAIFWQAPIATEQTFGDMAEVGYFVKWLMNTSGVGRPVLCRFFVNPSRLREGKIEENPDYLIYNKNDPSSWLNPAEIDKATRVTKESGYLGLFSENVIGFWVRSYGLDGNELDRSFDSRIGYSGKFRFRTQNGTIREDPEMRYLPASVVISLVQIDSRGAVMLDTVWQEIRDLTRQPTIHDAKEFYERFSAMAKNSPKLQTLLPYLRITSTEVHLKNAR